MFFRPYVAALCAALVSIAASSIAATAAEPDSAREANDFSAYLAFVADAPLTDADKQTVADQIRSDRNSNPEGVQQAHEMVVKFLASMPRLRPWELAEQREKVRYEFESVPPNPSTDIVKRHDPVVVLDRAHKRLISAATLNAWERASVWMARQLSIPEPGAQFVSGESAFLKAKYESLPEARQNAVAHIERNYPLMVFLIEHAEPATRADFVRRARPLARDAGQFPWRLAEAMSEGYDAVVAAAVKEKAASDASVLNSGLLLNGSYHMLFNHF
jgi:hypothetical protein